MKLNILESCMARLGWIIVCSHCSKKLKGSKSPAYCHACFYGYKEKEKEKE